MKALAALLIFIVFAQAEPPADYAAPTQGSRYDWRNSNWFGATAGTVTGFGISYNHWGTRNGWRLTLLPFATDEVFTLVAGTARMYSLNDAPPAQAGNWGFTNRHYYWFLSTAHGISSDSYSTDYLGALSGGFGVDLNRRVSRFSFMLGFGPYLSLGDQTELNFYPTLEFGWHFGAPHRIDP